MAAKPIAMEQLKQVLHLHGTGHSIKSIVRLTGLARNTVRSYLNRRSDASTDTNKATDSELAAVMFNQDTASIKSVKYQELLTRFENIEKELSRPGVTRQLLWREYLDADPQGYGYSQYCYYLQQFLNKKDVVMHLNYNPGQEIMVDFAGKKYFYVDMETGERIACEVFVATLPYSGLIFCRAVHSQKTADFLEASNYMLLYIGGVTLTVLCDNLKTVVTKSDRYEPTFTDLCYQLSEHYQTTFSATRPGKPRDKAMVEKAVNIVYRNIYAPLRNQTFSSLSEINHHFALLCDKINVQPYKGSGFSRRDLFNEQEKDVLRSLPTSVCLLKKGVVLTVQRNYHIQLREDGHYYSVPYNYVGKKVKVWYDQKTVEIYFDHERIAVHPRNMSGQSYITITEHMPLNHQQALESKGWSRDELIGKAKRVGPNTEQVAIRILGTSIYMEQNYKSCFGMIMLQKKYGTGRLENACARALTGTRINYTMIKNILQSGLDKQLQLVMDQALPLHDNIRGATQYL